MYTQQSNALAAALAMPAGQQQSQAILQVFANCVQGLKTNGPLSLNSGAASQSPRAGVIYSPPGVGDITNNYNITGDTLTDYYNNIGDRTFNEYPTNTWNLNTYNNTYNNPTNTSNYFTTNTTNNQGGDTANYFGGDTFYGDNYNTTNNIDNSQNFTTNNLNDYNTYNNYNNSTNTSVQNNNVSNWYNNQYTDNSYNDFTTTLQTTQNSYNQTVNNFEGDSYFDSSVHQGDVYNQSTVYNMSSVYNAGDTYFDESKVFITNIGGTVNIQQYITTIITNIFQGGGPGGGKSPPHTHPFKGTPAKIPVPKWKFNPDTCDIEKDGTEDIPFTPAGTVGKNA